MEQDVVLGIDIGGTKCAVLLARLNGEILERRQIYTRASERNPEAVLGELIGLAAELKKVSPSPIRSIGVVSGGPLDIRRGIICSPPNLPGWDDIHIVSLLSEELELPVRLENDANAGALAEWKFGAGVGVNNLIFLTMGTGIGGGLILDGKICQGANGQAGEVGHQTILPDGPLCSCGKRGCLEALASGPAIARMARESLLYGRHKRVLSLAGGKLTDITAEHIINAAKEGDAFAIAILEEAGTYLGIGLANLIQILNPELILLGTLAIHAGDLLLDPVRKAVKEYAWESSYKNCSILPAALGDRVQDLATIAILLD